MATRRVLIQVSVLVLLFGLVNAAAGKIIYVDADVPGKPFPNGSSWENAYPWLQAALDWASPGDEIWVAEGTYQPGQPGSILVGDQRTLTFELTNGVTLKGGYAGYGETDPDRRDIAGYESILSGDINSTGDPSDNCYHVVTGSGTDATAVLDGFTITAGNAAYPPYHTGGGMFTYQGSPTVRDCTFRGNISWGDGAGMDNWESSPTLINCTFCDNAASQGGESGGGGGLSNLFSSPIIIDCTFTGNSAWYGGAMHSGVASTPTLINCVFTNNSAGSDAGAMNNNESDATVTNCTFYDNSAYRVGGMRNINCSPIVTNCILWNNTDVVHDSDEWGQIDGIPGWMQIDYCCVQGWTGAPDPEGAGNISGDPLFGADCRLTAGSPCIDAGDSSVWSLSATDIDGNPRIVGLTVDMGAYEFQELLEHAAVVTDQLADELETLDLPEGAANSLTSKLENAIEAMRKGQTNAAIHKLEAFINEVEAQRDKKISEAEADALIAAAQAIIEVLLSL